MFYSQFNLEILFVHDRPLYGSSQNVTLRAFAVVIRVVMIIPRLLIRNCLRYDQIMSSMTLSHKLTLSFGIETKTINSTSQPIFIQPICVCISYFSDLAGSEVKFDQHGDGLARYEILNFQKANQSGTNGYYYRVSFDQIFVIVLPSQSYSPLNPLRVMPVRRTLVKTKSYKYSLFIDCPNSASIVFLHRILKM